MIQDHKNFHAQRAYSCDEATVIQKFHPLVRKLAWHLAGSTGPALDVDDLVQIGLIALTECARRHDRQCEAGLAAYAKLRVRGAMIDAIRKSQLQSRSARSDWKKLEGVREKLLAQIGREPTDSEIGKEIGLSAGEVAEMRFHSMPLSQVSVDDSYDEHESAFASDGIEGEEWLLQVESHEQLAEAIKGLSERHGMVIQLYFLEELNLAEIAAILEVSVPRVHQLKSAALKALRDQLTDTVSG